MKLCHFQQHGWTWRVLTLSERSQTEKDRYHDITHIAAGKLSTNTVTLLIFLLTPPQPVTMVMAAGMVVVELGQVLPFTTSAVEFLPQHVEAHIVRSCVCLFV
ncbi:unnamed protein product [Nyctereutes procyonoides]|uniref:(raccoon dog) hypothetical protein n=1 Tax=Nyctereutes procyonoides TaxID=34880 RepID=A0A811YQU8_NYCPR|nr:unnamed protein product [Nyctereutes procyonoides]